MFKIHKKPSVINKTIMEQVKTPDLTTESIEDLNSVGNNSIQG